MGHKSTKLAMIQMSVLGGEKERNLLHAEELIEEASSNGAGIAVLPECMDLGWTHHSSRDMAEPIPGGAPYKRLEEAAKRHQIMICSGLTEKSDEAIYNSAVLIDRGGKLLCKHRKIYELDFAHQFYGLGDKLQVVETEFGTIGLSICADGLVPDNVLAQSLCYMGADLILSPSAWAVRPEYDNAALPYGDDWLESYIPVATKFSTAIVGVSNVGPITSGPWKGRKCIGCSLGIGPAGEVLVQGPFGVDAEKIMYLDITLTGRPARGTDWKKYFFSSR